MVSSWKKKEVFNSKVVLYNERLPNFLAKVRTKRLD